MKSIYQQNNFTSGVLEPRLKGRTDIQQYFNGVEQADNVLLLPQGGMRLAPGLVYLDEVPEFNGGVGNVRMVSFPVSEDRQYLLVFIDGGILIYKNNVYLFELNDLMISSYSDDEVTTINTAQLDRVMICVQKDRGFRRIEAPVDGVDDTLKANWVFNDPSNPAVGPGLFERPIIAPQIDYFDALSPVPVDDIETFRLNNFSDGETFVLILGGIRTEDIVYSSVVTSLESNIVNALLNHPLTGDDGITATETQPAPIQQIDVTFSKSSANDYDPMSGYTTLGSGVVSLFNQVQQGSSRKEDAWSDTRGWPTAITFYAGRMYVGNLPYAKTTIFGSVSGDLLNFELGADDDEGIFATIASNKATEIQNLVSGRTLQIFTSGSEYIVPETIPTPSNFEIRAQTNYGSGLINPVQIDGSTLFLERKGKSLREFIFTNDEKSYGSNNISLLAQHLIIDPIDMDAQKGTSSSDANYVVMVNSDGTVTVLNTLRSQQIAGFTRRLTVNGKAIAVAVVDDVVYLTIEREINGATVRYLEYWSFDALFDSSKSYDFGTPQTLVTGLDHLEGQTVNVFADGANLFDKVVVSGEITLEREATTVEVGLWQTPVIKPMPLTGMLRDGSNQFRLKSVPRTSIRLYETSAVNYDGVTIPARKFQPAINSPLNTPPPVFTGVVGDIENNEGWEREQAPIITQEEPGQMTILSIEYTLESR